MVAHKNTVQNYANDLVRTRKIVQGFVKEWSNNFGLGWLQEFDINYCAERDEEEPNTAGKCTWMAHYLKATVYYYLPVLVDKSLDYIETVVVHEMVHIKIMFLASLASKLDKEDTRWKDAMELTVTQLTQAFLWTKRFHRKKARRGR